MAVTWLEKFINVNATNHDANSSVQRDSEFDILCTSTQKFNRQPTFFLFRFNVNFYYWAILC